MKKNIKIGKKLSRVLQVKSPAVASIPELAVVLIILGLMVTSFATFSKIIGIAKSNSIITSINTIKESSFTFKNTYQFLPGDIINANSTINNSQQNGNGDGFISWGAASSATTGNESLSFYQHLQSIGSINNITQANIISTTDASLTLNNVFRSNIDGSAFVAISFKPDSSSVIPSYGFDNSSGSSYTVVFGIIGGSASLFPVTNLAGTSITASTGKNFTSGAVDSAVLNSIDKKIDDANSQTGNVKFNQSDALPVAGFKIDIS